MSVFASYCNEWDFKSNELKCRIRKAPTAGCALCNENAGQEGANIRALSDGRRMARCAIRRHQVPTLARRVYLQANATRTIAPTGCSMKIKFAITCLIIGASLAPVASFCSDDADADRSHPKAFVKDSAITTKIKAKLAAAHLTSLARIHGDTDENGVVWLSGYARSQGEIDRAVSIAGATEGVKVVKNDLKIKKDD